MKEISEAAQAILDEVDAASDEHSEDLATQRDRTRAARRYINALRALNDYIADLEERANRK